VRRFDELVEQAMAGLEGVDALAAALPSDRAAA
jgi:hypothetical protein